MNGLPLASVRPIGLLDDPSERLAAAFDAHQERLFRLARRLTSNRDDALDLVQETFLRAARNPASIPVGLMGEEAWLVRVLINIRRDQWRRTVVRERHDPEMKPSSWSSGHQEDAVIARTTVWRALDALAPRRRAVVVMHELEGLTPPAIASLLGISAVTVRWHLSMGRRDLTRLVTSPKRESHEDR
ncbi:MAG TPA: RNA polymerase sigma factor [Vicinamibacterales bacterium]|jgi:RNA polymerase sigma-70 factor (ECF subfamily)